MNNEQILEMLKTLKLEDKNYILEQFNSDTNKENTHKVLEELNEAKHSKGYICPHCESKEVKRNGNKTLKSGEKLQRYKCNNCNKTFTDNTNTILAYSKKSDRWLEFIEYSLEGLSLREIAKRMGDISYVSLFYWRHKLLKSLNSMFKNKLTGIIKIDETYFLQSNKGDKNLTRSPRKRGGKSKYRGLSNEQNAILIARTRDKQTMFTMVGKGRLSSKEIKSSLDYILNIDNSLILCTDGLKAYRTLFI